jgi:hypothetical protein
VATLFLKEITWKSDIQNSKVEHQVIMHMFAISKTYNPIFSLVGFH